MLRKLYFIFILFLLCFFIQGCLGPQPKVVNTTFYTLEYESPEFEETPVLPITLQVKNFQIAPDYNTNNIIYRGNAYSRNQYHYKKWRSNPRELVTYFFSRDLRKSNLFRGVYPPGSLLRSSYLIFGTVDEFYEKDDDPWQAVLKVSITLLKANEPDITKRVVFQKSYSSKIPCADKTTEAFVQAMGKAMAAVSSEIIEDIYDRLFVNLDEP